VNADYEKTAEIHAAAFAGAERGWSAEEIRALAERPGGLLIEAPHGFALGQAIGDEAEILTIAIRPDRQNRGEGRALLAAMEAEAAARGARRVFLDVAENNLPARKLYAAAGFAVDGRRPRYYRRQDGERFDAILMSKSLESSA
jgi:ribosomal-protein-alanine N-acetyltransferase